MTEPDANPERARKSVVELKMWLMRTMIAIQVECVGKGRRRRVVSKINAESAPGVLEVLGDYRNV